MTDLAERYLDVITRAVNGDLHGPQSVHVPVQGTGPVRRLAAQAVEGIRKRAGIHVTRHVPIPESAYAQGEGWPWTRSGMAESMVGRARLANIREAVEAVIADNVPGDLIETGVWRGGSTILMRAVLAARDVSDRTVYVADSFEGLPKTERADDDAGYLHEDDTLAVSLEQVQAAFERYGLLDSQVRFVKGWFKDTLPDLRGQTWAVVRLDGDMYDSTMDALVNLYPGLSPGGWLIVDDYYAYEACRRAITDYRSQHGITEPIKRIDGQGVYWRRTG